MNGSSATYRFQLSPSFTLRDAAAATPYLAGLGVSHVYLSPVFEATPGSTHGYDVTDPTRLRDELGGAAAFDELRAAADEHGLGVVADMVPNHMAANDHNAWWRDPECAHVFDIDPVSGEHRRFFDIDDLAAVRQEDPRVFAMTHTLITQLRVDGLRVDHVDGLRDPPGYLERLRAARPDTWIVVEKILARDETLPVSWPVAGTTGYDFAARAIGVFVDPAAQVPLDALYVEATGDRRTWDGAARAGKRFALEHGLARDVARVARAFGDAYLSDVVTELAVEWPVYRTYTRPGQVSAADSAVIESTCARVRALLPERAGAVDLIEGALLRRTEDGEGADRFQMLTSPAMAKGVEDRAFYNYTRFIALNEVGGDPDVFGVSVDDWHAACAAVADQQPTTMLTTATHDTKRGEDVRARLAAITYRTDWWAEAASKWMARHDRLDGPTAYLLLQTLVGAWPVSHDRLDAYMRKAVREAAAHTSWASPDDAYERAVADEVAAGLDERAVIEDLVGPLRAPGHVNALAQTLLRLTAPGVPDTYQGTEFADFSLVDPDNRRPVNFAAAPTAKTAVVRAALAARREFPHAFAGDYRPLATDSDDVLAYLRGDDVAVVVPLRGGETGRVELPPGTWTDRLPDAPVSLLCR